MAATPRAAKPKSNKSDPWTPSPRLVRVMLGAPLLLAVGLFLLAKFLVQTGFWHDVLEALSEAFFVAFTLALVGDIYLRHKLVVEAIAKGVRTTIAQVFGFLDPNGPSELYAAVEEFGGQKIYLRSAHWKLRFDWVDRDKEILRTTLSVTNTGHNLDRDGFLPSSPLWVIEPMQGDYAADYLQYSLHCPPDKVSVNPEPQDLRAYLSHERGRLILDQERLLSESPDCPNRISYHQEFTATRKACLHQQGSGYIPLMHSLFEIEFKLEFCGDALNDISISVFHPKSGSTDQDWWNWPDSEVLIRAWRSVTPGQATLVSWVSRRDARHHPFSQPAQVN